MPVPLQRQDRCASNRHGLMHGCQTKAPGDNVDAGIRCRLLDAQQVIYEGLAKSPEDRQKLYREYVENTRPYEEVLDRELVGI